MTIHLCVNCKLFDTEDHVMKDIEHHMWDDAVKLRVNCYKCHWCGFVAKFSHEEDTPHVDNN